MAKKTIWDVRKEKREKTQKGLQSHATGQHAIDVFICGCQVINMHERLRDCGNIDYVATAVVNKRQH